MKKVSIDEAKQMLQASFEARVLHGHKCPICRVYTKRYKINFNRTYVRALQKLVELAHVWADDDGWFKIGKDVLGKETCLDLQHMKYSKLRYFGLIEPMGKGHNRRPYAGYWRVLLKGYLFLKGKSKVFAYVREQHRQVVKWSKRTIDVHEAYGKHFDFDEEVLGSS